MSDPAETSDLPPLTTCPNCESNDLSWDHTVREITTYLTLGCDECSETLAVVTLDEFLTLARRTFGRFDLTVVETLAREAETA